MEIEAKSSKKVWENWKGGGKKKERLNEMKL